MFNVGSRTRMYFIAVSAPTRGINHLQSSHTHMIPLSNDLVHVTIQIFVTLLATSIRHQLL